MVVMGDGTAAESLDALRSMPVSTAMGGYVPLSAVAQVEVIQAPQSIQRVNQSRQVTISGDMADDESLLGWFIRSGVDGINVSAASVLPLRRRVRNLDLNEG